MTIYVKDTQLSPEALVALNRAGNKSLFVREAIEFYVHHGTQILKELKDIKAIIENVPNLSTKLESKELSEKNIPETSFEKEVIESKSVRNKDFEMDSNENNDLSEKKKREIEEDLIRSINMF